VLTWHGFQFQQQQNHDDDEDGKPIPLVVIAIEIELVAFPHHLISPQFPSLHPHGTAYN